MAYRSRFGWTLGLVAFLALALSSSDLALAGKGGNGGGGKPGGGGGGDEVAPAAVTDLQVDGFTHDTVDIQWTATADDGDDPASGPATSYDVRFIEGTLDDGTWAEAYGAYYEPAPSDPGTVELYSPEGFLPGRTYEIGLKVLDEAGNASAISNVVTVTTALGDWEVLTVDSFVANGHSLAFDASGNPLVAYVKDGALLYAAFDGNGWSYEVIDGQGQPDSLTMRIDPVTLQPTISYADSQLHFARRHGPDDWNVEVVDSKVWNHKASLAYDLDDNPTIAYGGKVGKNATIKYAIWNGSSWDVETVGGLRHVRHDIDPTTGRTWLAYEGGNNVLSCSYRDPGDTDWTTFVLEDGPTGSGRGVSMDLHPATGYPGIIHDGSETLFEWDGSGWVEDADGGPRFAHRLAYATENGTRTIAWCEYQAPRRKILRQIWITRKVLDPVLGWTWVDEYIINGVGTGGEFQYHADGRAATLASGQVADGRWDLRYIIQRPTP